VNLQFAYHIMRYGLAQNYKMYDLIFFKCEVWKWY